MNKRASQRHGPDFAYIPRRVAVQRSLKVIAAAGASLLFAASTATTASASANRASGSGPTITLTEQDYYFVGAGPIHTYLNTLFANFMKLHPNIVIQRTTIPPSDYFTKVTDEAGANALPDVLMLDNPDLPYFAEYGVLAPLGSLGRTAISALQAPQQSESSFNGTVYAYPLYTNTIALFYNKTMFAAAGLQPPTTWAQLLTDAKALTTPAHYGIAFSGQTGPGQNVWQFEPFLWSNGGNLTQLTSPQSVQALTLWTDLVQEKAVSPAVTTWGQVQPENFFADSKAAMMVNGPWFLSTLNGVKGLDYGVAEIPVNTPGQNVVPPIGGELWTIPKSSSATEKAAFELLNYMASPSVDEQLSLAEGDVPTVKAALGPWKSKAGAQLQPFLQELLHGEARTAVLGTNYPAVETVVGNAIEAALLGKQTPAQAFAAAQKQVQSVIYGS
ncbi:MAG TPA: extracellular solute-binding protein [Acidimicrobiales bacterium]|nr:extracellular solute-binding protein [Acidimicrobiales bacterium]